VTSRRNGVFCLEGEWDGRLTDRTSVEPQLTMLENMKCCGGVIHRDVATRDELEYYVGKWLQRQHSNYTVGYFAFHGSPGMIQLGRDELTLDQLAEIVGPTADGRTIYFGSCETLAASDEDLQAFCRKTRVRAVVGYTRWVGWLETAAFDFILLPQLLDSVYVKPIFTRLSKDHARFVTGLGLRMATTNWATPRKIAVDAIAK
jgi:hypothetical protein